MARRSSAGLDSGWLRLGAKRHRHLLSPGRKKGESNPSGGSGKTIEVAGFETNQHLGFFVSGLRAQENLRIASKLALALRNFLTQLER